MDDGDRTEALVLLKKLGVRCRAHVYNKALAESFFSGPRGGTRLWKDGVDGLLGEMVMVIRGDGDVSLYVDPQDREYADSSFRSILPLFDPGVQLNTLVGIEKGMVSYRVPMNAGYLRMVDLHLVHSHRDPGIQAADLVAGAVFQFSAR